MYIKVEPKSWNMYSVYLIFDQVAPHPEDDGVRQYLTDHGLVPQTVTKTVLDDRDCDVMYFGGCYLGRHQKAIVQIQQYAMKQEMLSVELPDMLRKGPNSQARDRVAEMDGDQLWSEVTRLVEEYNNDSSFELDDDGQPRIALDPGVVQESFLNLVAVARS